MLRTLNALMINIINISTNDTNEMWGKHITDVLNSGKKAVFTVGAVSKKTKQEKSQHLLFIFNEYAFVLFFLCLLEF